MPRRNGQIKRIRGKTGLRNRKRTGIGTYKTQNKRKNAETYGKEV